MKQNQGIEVLDRGRPEGERIAFEPVEPQHPDPYMMMISQATATRSRVFFGPSADTVIEVVPTSQGPGDRADYL